jgi:hypothetical protein
MQDLLYFESQIERRFLTTNAIYRYICRTQTAVSYVEYHILY